MSTRLKTIKGTGKGVDLDITRYWGGDKNGQMIQLTQGLGMERDEPGYIQLTSYDAYQVVIALTQWLKQIAEDKKNKIQEAIDENQALKKTILQDAVECERFIRDLEIIKVPLMLLGVSKEEGSD